ncbi:MAG: lipid-A-disaccharide synthase [Bacteroidia bacterium]|nr:lipid-A-disaccharide synthase [Bacteroidia bacterium]
MKYYLITGEASGDLHGSNLIKELKKITPDSTFRCWGGDLMAMQGAVIVRHYKELAFMGFIEVLLNIVSIFKNFRLCKNDIKQFSPDVVILIDYPGFNLRMAKYIKKLGIKVFYYISPQIWAWKQSRIDLIKKYVDRMYVILPFEEDFYRKFAHRVHFVGHPLFDAIDSVEQNKTDFSTFISQNGLSNKPVIALLPGSRSQEIRVMLPIMLKMFEYYPGFQFVIAGAPSQKGSFYDKYIRKTKVKVLFAQTYNILQHASIAIVTSGTATLETALFDVPQVVCYKTGRKISYLIAKHLVKVKYISLMNIIMDKEIVKEFIQNEFNPANLKTEMDKLLFDIDYKYKILSDYKLLKEKLGGAGASQRAARLIFDHLINTKF